MGTLKHRATKLVRPFLGWEDCRKLLSNASIRLRSAEEPTADELVTMRFEDTASLELGIFANVDPSSLAASLSALRLSSKEVELSIFVNSPGLKQSVLAYKCALSAIPSDAMVLDEMATDLAKSRGGINVTVALILAKQLKPEALRPFFFGEWIARKDFALRPEISSEVFNLKRLTDEAKQKFGLPRGTTFWVSMEGGSLNDPESSLTDILTIWMDEAVYDHLARSNISPASVGIQKLMLADVVSSIVCEALSDKEEEVVPKSPLDGFLKDLSKSCGKNRKELERLVRGDKFKFRAYVQHMLDTSRYICSAT